MNYGYIKELLLLVRNYDILRLIVSCKEVKKVLNKSLQRFQKY